MMLHNREVGGGSRFVMLQAPGLNTATLGVLLMVAIHLMILASYHWA